MAGRDGEARRRRDREQVVGYEEDYSRGEVDIQPWDSISQRNRVRSRPERQNRSRRAPSMSSTASRPSRHRHNSRQSPDPTQPRYRRDADDNQPMRTGTRTRRHRYKDEDNDMSAISEESRTRDGQIEYARVTDEKDGQRYRERQKKEVEVTVNPIRRSSTTTSHRSSRPPKTRRRIRDERPPLSRSQSTRSSNLQYEHSISSQHSRRSSFISSLFTPAQKSRPTSRQTSRPSRRASRPPLPPVQFVECLTCMADDVPYDRSALLKCGHRMCHSCLKRVFRLSVRDAQHMPPKCCTNDHIDLEHVENLFDVDFKILWNRKFQEYTTANRLYCPTRRCGEWIEPSSIRKDRGREYAKCSSCKTKVCCLCNGLWHGGRDCPKDEATNALLEAAKQSGWQRCYNCRTMIELKEGCNHMTCHCTAEFCMVCGLKWKTCTCPWFSYETVEADRLNHMRVPRDHHHNNDDIVMGRRRREERLDRDLARRLADLGLETFNDNIGVHGVRILDHIMNETYQRPFLQRPRSPPPYEMHLPLRRGEQRAADYNAAARPSERVVPPRFVRDYLAEAAVHAPRRPRRMSPPPMPVHPPPVPRSSTLAGIERGARGSARVGAWASYVEPVAPPDGVLSM